MNKIIISILVTLCCAYKINAQAMDAVYTSKDTSVSIKQTVYNTARFLSFQDSRVIHIGEGRDIPGLAYTFTLNKNTVIQISNTVTFRTTNCILCPETGIFIEVVVDNAVFASYLFRGDDNEQSTCGMALAQLPPGTHTIKVKIKSAEKEGGDVQILGYNVNNGNRTHMSLLFFEQ